MEKVGFIGNYDKIDLMIYTAKVLAKLGKKTLIIDATGNQKSRYIVPSINPTVSYITEFESIDIAVGFEDFESVQKYFGVEDEFQLNYDYILFDIDSSIKIEKMRISNLDRNYFVTAFDLYSLNKGVEALNNLQMPFKLTKIYFTKTFYKEEDEYLNYLALGRKVIWNENIIYMPLESGDATAIAENQRLGKIKFKNLTPDYKEGIACVVSDITGNTVKTIRNTIKILE